MWGEALSMLDRADRLHRHFFTHAQASWEPPVDIVEAEDALHVQVALPGVPADSITLVTDNAGLTVSALRSFAGAQCGNGSHIHRLEIPYGRFERRIAIDMDQMELTHKALQDGVLALTFRRREGK